MTEEINQSPEEEKASGTDVKKDAKGLFKSISSFLSDLLDIRGETDKDQTIADIKKDIAFKGHTAWILIFAVFIASIGLNVSSTAVVIGAMLISPLMGPILGIGLSLAIYDIDTLKRSLVNLGVMVGLSVFTAFLYFKLSPLTEETPELVARKAPIILDVLIAIFGGFALIVARSKKGTMASVIFGVAIATALMPPLCTVGYGLAIGDPKFYLGALYLFCINTIFIALATFVVAKILSFPLVKYANEAKRNKIKWTVTIIAVLAIVPAILTFITVLEKSNQDRDIRNFIKNEIKSNEELFYSNHEVNYDKKKISFTFFSELPDETIADLKNDKNSYEYIKDFKFKFKGNKVKSFDLISTAYQDSQKRVEQKNNVIKGLQGTIENLKAELESKNKKLPLDFLKISKEAKINFYDLKSISFYKELKSDFKKIDTLPTARIIWRSLLDDSLALKRNNKLRVWLKNEMKLDTVYVRN
mgnify:FL=1|tara:strand:+ start:8569 stop:9987 length:1419 start_codon:yes stop_codon:yes gene_type:complete